MGRSYVIPPAEARYQRRYWGEVAGTARVVGWIVLGMGGFFYGQAAAQNADAHPPVHFHGSQSQAEHQQMIHNFENLAPGAATAALGMLAIGAGGLAKRIEDRYLDALNDFYADRQAAERQ